MTEFSLRPSSCRSVRVLVSICFAFCWQILAPWAQAQPFTTTVAERCRTDLWNVNHIAGWQLQWPSAVESVPVGTPDEQAEALRQWDGFPEIVDQEIKTLQKGLREGFSAPRPVVERVQAQLQSLIDLSPEDSPLWSPARRASDESFRRAWDALARNRIRPSFQRILDFLNDDYLPAAREDVGLHAVPGGRLCYARLVERWTTMDLSPKELREIGERQMTALHEELDVLAAEHFDTTADELIRRLRDGSVPGSFKSEVEVISHARDAIARARSAIPELFAAVPSVSVVVRSMPRHRADGAPAGYYVPPTRSGEDAVYLINATRPVERRLMNEAIAFHETIPGHHLQMVLGERSRPYNAGFAEGWAIYAERLADEAGLYSTPLDRAGMLVKHLWAASRLIVDPAIHVSGWSRKEAIDYMRKHTTLSREEVEVEVDRYIALPGQSLSYVLGYLEIRRLRTMAENELGDNFDLRVFHDVVLRDGFVTLPELAEKVEKWVASMMVQNDVQHAHKSAQ